MTAIELRIGNYIKFDGHVVQCVPNTILQFDRCRSKRYTPIPLTEQWLLDFGFKFRKAFIGEQDKWAKYGTWELNGCCFQGTKDGTKLFKGFTLKYSYVHELQNIYFALIGKELEHKNKQLWIV